MKYAFGGVLVGCVSIYNHIYTVYIYIIQCIYIYTVYIYIYTQYIYIHLFGHERGKAADQLGGKMQGI